MNNNLKQFEIKGQTDVEETLKRLRKK